MFTINHPSDFEAFQPEFESMQAAIKAENVDRAFNHFMEVSNAFHAESESMSDTDFFAAYAEVNRAGLEFEQAVDEFKSAYNRANPGPDFPPETEQEFYERNQTDFVRIDEEA